VGAGEFPEFVKKGEFEMVIFPYPSNPWVADFYKKKVKTVVMVHDCIPWKNKKYRKGLLSKMYQAQSRRAVKKADLVFDGVAVFKERYRGLVWGGGGQGEGDL